MTLEIYDPKTDALVTRWDVEISTPGTSRPAPSGPTPSSCYAHPEGRACAVRRPATEWSCAQQVRAPRCLGWSTCTLRSTDGMVRQSLGTTVEHNGLGASTTYWRRS